MKKQRHGKFNTQPHKWNPAGWAAKSAWRAVQPEAEDFLNKAESCWNHQKDKMEELGSRLIWEFALAMFLSIAGGIAVGALVKRQLPPPKRFRF